MPGATWTVDERGGRTLFAERPDGTEALRLGYVARKTNDHCTPVNWYVMFDDTVDRAYFAHFYLLVRSRREGMRLLEQLVLSPTRAAAEHARYEALVNKLFLEGPGRD